MAKQKCPWCEKTFFVGDVGEILDLLCYKHKKEHLKQETKIIKDYLVLMPKNVKNKKTVISIKKNNRYKSISFPDL